MASLIALNAWLSFSLTNKQILISISFQSHWRLKNQPFWNKYCFPNLTGFFTVLYQTFVQSSLHSGPVTSRAYCRGFSACVYLNIITFIRLNRGSWWSAQREASPQLTAPTVLWGRRSNYDPLSCCGPQPCIPIRSDVVTSRETDDCRLWSKWLKDLQLEPFRVSELLVHLTTASSTLGQYDNLSNMFRFIQSKKNNEIDLTQK